MWATIVDRDGVVCAVAFSGSDRAAQWPGSRVISAQKASTANAFGLSTIGHEAVHGAIAVFEDKQILINNATQEPFAYYQTYLFTFRLLLNFTYENEVHKAPLRMNVVKS
jgi:hypothetical protein